MNDSAIPQSLLALPTWASARGIAPDDPEYAALAARLRTVDPVAFAVALGFAPALHHRAMLEAVRRVIDGKVDVLLVDSPPGSAKSTYITLCGSLYLLARDPKARIILGTNSERLSEHWGRQLRNHLDTPEWRALASYGGAVGELTLEMAEDSRAAARFALDGGGGFLGCGIGATLLGHRCDYLLLDDLVESYETAFSETQLSKISTWLKSDAISRLDGRIRVISVMQRMAANDPHGFLPRHVAGIEGLRVEHLTLRMIAEEDDPLGRAPGDPLWPEHYSPQTIAVARRDAVSWQTRYQQRPILSTGEWCRPEWIVLDSSPPSIAECRVYICSDFATGALRGDFTVHAVVRVRRDTNGLRHLHVIDVFRERTDVLSGLDMVFVLARRWGARSWVLDDDFFAKSLWGFTEERMRTTGCFLNVRALPLGGKDKETRAASLRALLADHRLHILADQPWTQVLVDELLLFPLGGDAPGVDDQIDALSVLARDLARTSGTTLVAEHRMQAYTMPGGEVVMLPLPANAPDPDAWMSRAKAANERHF